MARGAGRSILVLVLLALVAGGAWLFRDRVPGPWSAAPVHTEVSEAAAAAADAKLARLREEGDTVRLSGVEFTSYVRFRMADRFALDIETPIVRFEGGAVRLDGRLPKERIPTDRLGAAARFVPDTADVAVRGSLRTLAPGRAALRVESASFARIPIPREQYVGVLDRVAPDEPGIADDEIAFQLPAGVASARVEGGVLVLAPDLAP